MRLHPVTGPHLVGAVVGVILCQSTRLRRAGESSALVPFQLTADSTAHRVALGARDPRQQRTPVRCTTDPAAREERDNGFASSYFTSPIGSMQRWVIARCTYSPRLQARSLPHREDDCNG